MYLYAARNFSALVGLGSPDPMANMYDRTYFRATWVLTALDAGFWTAMRIRTRWLRDAASLVFSLFYLVAAEAADEKVRKVRGVMTVEHLRVSWNKGTSPYLSAFQRLLRPRFTRWPPRQIRIPRPADSDYREPVVGWLYYDGPVADMEHHNRVILDMPGGGFVAMDPRCNDDKLFAWAAKTGLPILSLDYKKAPEFPYPYALNECYDVYASLVTTKGRCIGMAGRERPRIVLAGDSAGGNLAVAMTLKILEMSAGPLARDGSRSSALPAPDGVVCFYPALDMNIGSWMSDDQLSLIQESRMRKTTGPIARRKSLQYDRLIGTPHHSDDEDEDEDAIDGNAKDKAAIEESRADPLAKKKAGSDRASPRRPSKSRTRAQPLATATAPAATGGSVSRTPGAEPMRTRLATSSMIAYTNDRVLTPEMMRAIIILYIGAHNRPDFTNDYLLSPVRAPDALLARFPKIYLMTGERDPLVDDTVVFAARLRRAKEAAAAAAAAATARSATSQEDGSRGRDVEAAAEADSAEVMLLPGVSHGFMQFPSVYPPAWKHFDRSAAWFEHLMAQADRARNLQLRPMKDKSAAMATTAAAGGREGLRNQGAPSRPRAPPAAGESSGEEDRPLEMTSTRGRNPSQGQFQGNNHGAQQQQQQETKTTPVPMLAPLPTAVSQGMSEGGEARAGMGESRGRDGVESRDQNQDQDQDQDQNQDHDDQNRRQGQGRGRGQGRGQGRGKVGKTAKGGNLRKNKSLVQLASTDDLLGRRMQGLAGALTGPVDEG